MAFEDDSDTLTTTPLKPAGTPLPAQIKDSLPSAAPRLASAAASVPAPQAPPPSAAVAPQEKPDSWDSMMQRFLSSSRAHESGGNDQAVNKATGATGRYQFLPSTWMGVISSHPELGLTPQDIYNGDKQDLALRAFASDNAKVLQKSGIAVNPANLFMMSFMGSGGGPAFIKQMEQTPGAGAAALFPKEATYNPGVFYTPDGRQRTLGEVYQLTTKSFGGQGPTTGPQAQLLAANGAGVRSDAVVDAAASEELPPAIAAAQQKLNPAAAAPVAAPAAPIAAPAAVGGSELPDAIRKAQEALNPAALSAPAASTSQNPFLVDPKSEAPKKDEPDILGVDAGGEPIFADPKQTEEYQKAKIESVKGAASGVGQDVTGLGEWLPGSAGAAAARGTKYLEGVGDPAAQFIGRNAPLAVPIGEGLGIAKLGAKAISEGLPVAEDLGAQMLRGGTLGAKTAAIAGATSPTGEEDTGKRYARKIGDLAADTAAGAVGGAVVPAAVGSAKWVAHELASLPADIQKAIGKQAAKAAQEVRTGVSAETGAKLTEQQVAAAQAKTQEGILRAEQGAAEATVKRLNDEFAARPTVQPEIFGKQLQETAEKDALALKDARSKLSGYDAAANADGGRPSVPTKQFIGDVAEAESRAVSAPMRGVLAELKESLRTPGDRANATVTAVSIQRARRIIQNLDSKVDQLAGDEKNELLGLKDKLVAHLEAVHPELAKAKQRYAELSRPLDVYRDSGPLAKAVLEDPYSSKNIVDTTKVVGALLNKTEANADAFGRLIRTGGLQDSARKFFTQKLADVSTTKSAPAYSDYARLLRDQRLALDRSGLTGEFKAVAEKQKAAEETLNAAHTETKQKINDMVSSRVDAETKANTLQKYKNQIDTIDDKLLKDVPGTAKSIVNGMMTSKIIDAETHKRLLNEIENVDIKFADEAAARKKIRNILILGAGVVGAPFIRHTLPMNIGGH